MGDIDVGSLEGLRLLFRADAAFAKPEIYQYMETRRIGYAIRLPANEVFQREITHLLTRPTEWPSRNPIVSYHDFGYQAQSWNAPRRVVAKLDWHQGELFPRVGFIVTNLSFPTATTTLGQMIEANEQAFVKIVAGEVSGSGVIVDSRGIIITADHIISSSADIQVVLGTGEKVSATLAGRYLPGDIAFLTLAEGTYSYLSINTSVEPLAGDSITQIGYRNGSDEFVIHGGLLAGQIKNERIGRTLLTSDLTFEEGFKGAPVLDHNGALLGLLTNRFVLSSDAESAHITLAEPLVADFEALMDGALICPPMESDFNGSVVRNDEYGLQVVNPDGAGWFNRQTTVALWVADNNNRSLATGGIVYNPSTAGDYDTLNDYLNAWVDVFENNKSYVHFEVMSTQATCLPPFGEALEAEVLLEDDLDWRERWLIVFTGGLAFNVRGYARPGMWDLKQQDIDNFLYSLQFK